MLPDLPTDPDQISSDWLTRALAPRLPGAQVLRSSACRIGEAQGFSGGALYRIALEGTGDLPSSVVAKVSPADPVMARRLWPANAREVAFYASAHGVEPCMPRFYFGATDPARHASLLILEDLAPARSVRFAKGLNATDAGAVVDALGALHARHWQGEVPNAGRPDALVDEFDFAGCWVRFPVEIARLLPDVALPSTFLALGDHLAAGQGAALRTLLAGGTQTLLHRDVQADNVAFRAGGEAVLIDWQMVGPGPGAWDLAYLLSGSLTPDTRRGAEANLVARYHGVLVREGVAGYPLAACRTDYLRGVAGKIFFTVVATLLFDNAAPAKRDWRRTDLMRLLAFCADHAITPATFG